MKRPVGRLEEWEWIEKYWAGKLSPEERLFFEKEMEEDDRLAREAASLRPGVQLMEELRFEENARGTLEKLRADKRKARRHTRIIALGFALTAAACAGFIAFLSFAPLQLPAHENDLSILRDLRTKYRQDSTHNLSLDKKQAFDYFFEGQAALAEGDPRLAQVKFEKVLSYPNLRPYFREAAQWHLVICYLKNSESEKAGRIYRDLEDAHQYTIPRVERWKVWWHLKKSQLAGGA